MKQRSIFGSGLERAVFSALRSRWEKRVDIFPQVSVKSVVGFDRIQTITDESERDYLLKTEFDYVICKKATGVPLLVVELDGFGEGFSRGLEYETSAPRNANRHQKLEAKLRVCAKADIPAVVVALPETQRLESASRLTVLDGIIGEVLAHGIFRTSLEVNTFESVDTVEDLETTLSIRDNPVKAEISRLLVALDAVHTGDGMIRSQTPQADRSQDGMVGCQTVVSCRKQEFTATVYIRDINCAGFTAYGLAEELSWLVAIRHAARCAGISLPDPGAAQQCSGRGTARMEPRR